MPKAGQRSGKEAQSRRRQRANLIILVGSNPVGVGQMESKDDFFDWDDFFAWLFIHREQPELLSGQNIERRYCAVLPTTVHTWWLVLD
jgi:hypothetical protein